MRPDELSPVPPVGEPVPSRSPGRWPPVLPQDDQQVLDFLGIRQQCLEWANASVDIPTGGSYRGHTAAAITDVTRIQPGRGLWANNWSNPVG
jgi:hypothetical protein